jgi:exodeoxyribonuclease VII small subunit
LGSNRKPAGLAIQRWIDRVLGVGYGTGPSSTEKACVARKSTKGVDFERALDELEKLVERMEKGELSLEESLKLYERGMELSKSCQKALDAAEKRIRILSEQDGKSELDSFESDQD